ncbi:hypothetical protein TNCV_807921 [Trichonephila clavipes]|nr:hypothetical protein TNCV_807921 [Trichonephila clavipes]
MSFTMAHDRGTVVREITTPTSQPLSGLVQRHYHMRRYPLETHLLPLTKSSKIGKKRFKLVLSIIFDQFFKYWMELLLSVRSKYCPY